MALLSVLLAALALSTAINAHPQTPEDIKRELEIRSHVTAHSKRSLDKCANTPAALALRERAIARRAAKAKELRAKRGLKSKRDDAAWAQWQTVSHDQTSTGYTLDTPLETIFASNTTCSLVPESEIGPYYVAGELIRTEISDGQDGVASHLDIQFVNINTCEAVTDLLIDIWHCNATGVYSGVSAANEGGLDTTFGRGIQQSDSDGVVQFDTVFPGHYSGRATHIHIITTSNGTVLENGTYTDGTAQHIGQMFFDSDLRDAVEALEPYSTNTQTVTSNAEDHVGPDASTDEYDPFLNYVTLGDDVADGLLLWTTIGIDPSADYSDGVTPAAHYYEGGGVDASDGSSGGGPPRV